MEQSRMPIRRTQEAPRGMPLIEGLMHLDSDFYPAERVGSVLRVLGRMNNDYVNSLEFREGQARLMLKLVDKIQSRERRKDGSERGYAVSMPMHGGKTFLEVFAIVANAEFNNGRGILLSPKEDLAKEHIGMAHEMLGADRAMLLTGGISPAVRHMHSGDANIFIGTPETVWNDYSSGHLHIEKGKDIIVIDEAHKNVGDYASAKLCDATNVKVFGFTATLGGNWQKVLGIMERAGFDEIDVLTPENNLGSYTAGRSIETIMIDPAGYITGISDHLVSFMRERLEELAAANIRTPRHFLGRIHDGSFYGIPERTNNGIGSMDEIFREAQKLNSPRLMTVYGELHRAVQSYDALTLGSTSALLSKVREWKSGKQSVSLANFLGDGRIMHALDAAERSAASGLEHPKMEFLYAYAKANPEAQVIVFANHRNTVHMIADRMNARGIQARAYTGKGRGMTKQEKSEVEEGLADGSVRWVIATSVASEGVNKFDVGHLICYDQAISAIEQEQRMGRVGRNVYGVVKELVYIGSMDEQRHMIFKHQMRNARKVNERLRSIGASAQAPVNVQLRKEQEMQGAHARRKPSQLRLGVEHTMIRPKANIEEIVRLISTMPSGKKSKSTSWQQSFEFVRSEHRDDN